jgi:hypothetical protein
MIHETLLQAAQAAINKLFSDRSVPVAAFSTVAAIMVLCGVAAPLTIWIGHQTQKRKQP